MCLQSTVSRVWVLVFLQFLVFFLGNIASYDLDDEDEDEYIISHDAATVPHCCLPGFVVISLGVFGVNFAEFASGGNATGYFAMLRNGDVITTNDISGLLGQDVRLIVSGRIRGQTWTETILVRVRHCDETFAFTRQLYEGRVMENSQKNSPIGGLENLKANRKDRPTSVQYSLTSGRTDLFAVVENGDGSRGLLSLQLLDFEVETQYALTLMAMSNHSTDLPIFARIRVFVENVNDNAPVLEESSYHAAVGDGTPLNVPLVRLAAFDADGDPLEYRVEPKVPEFSVDRHSGYFFLRQNCSFLRSPGYEFLAFAVDGDGKRGLPATVTIETRCLTTPRGRRNVLWSREFEIPESMYGDLLTLGNGTNQLFRFRDPGPKDLAVNPVTGTVRLRDGKKLDYETQPEIDFVVVITRVDNATCESSSLHRKLHIHF